MTTVTYDMRERVATIVLDDGKVNALSLPTFVEINAALDQAAVDKAVVVLAGRENVFSAGFDLKALTSGGATTAAMLRAGFELAERLLSFPTPVVIACTGNTIAMGVFLLLSGDYRIGAAGPYKIQANEVALGMPMPQAAIEVCRQRLAPAHFNRAIMLAEVYPPESAIAAGFLDRVVPPAEVLEVSRETAAGFAKLNMAAHAASKLCARDLALKALRSAIESDAAAFGL